ncbi:MAG: aminoacyl-tRNA hydrolase [Bacteroidales bacterium]|nr:aminoacyl-tRNA hydrolase [Bacteroidales bacterium]
MKFLIVGLGNIGAEYANTRHNIGFMVLDQLAADAKTDFKTERYAYRAEVRVKGRTLVLIKPTTYMNLSGKAVRYWMQQENIPVENMLVVVDDLALDVGQLRLKKSGGDGGHNGLIDITLKLDTQNFNRLRFGIGADFAKGFQSEYVLSRFTSLENEIVEPKLKQATELIKSFVTMGADRTMTLFNNK